MEEKEPASAYLKELRRIFRSAPNKHEAHRRSRAVLQDISTDRNFLRAVLQRYLSMPKILNSKNYPVIGVEVDLNPDYHLVANCWIPLPDRQTDISTKAIHHHGTMLMTSGTVFGPGYEHWLFSQPEEIEPEQELYAMEVTERKSHPLHDVAFVDAYEPHLPLFPSGLTITLALWSDRSRTGLMDRLKRVPLFKKNEALLKRWTAGMGLARALRLKRVEYFDFYPSRNGFKGMKQRVEFGLGPNEDYLQSLFHVLQQTQSDTLIPVIEGHLQSGQIRIQNRDKIQALVGQLRQGRPIEGRLSECHLNVPHAIFKSREIEQTVRTLRTRTSKTPWQPTPSPGGS